MVSKRDNSFLKPDSEGGEIFGGAGGYRGRGVFPVVDGSIFDVDGFIIKIEG